MRGVKTYQPPGQMPPVPAFIDSLEPSPYWQTPAGPPLWIERTTLQALFH